MKKDYITPIVLIALALAIAGALALGTKKPQESALKIPSPITEYDLIMGNPEADVLVVEYSDMECPFCKDLHETMNKVVSEMSDEFAWVYRHFPLDSLHSKARKEAEAVTCVSKLSTPENGFAYLNEIMRITPSNNNLDLDTLYTEAEKYDITKNQLDECLSSKEIKDIVENNAQEAISLGARGTPFTVIYRKSDGKMEKNSGFMNYETLKSKIIKFLQK